MTRSIAMIAALAVSVTMGAASASAATTTTTLNVNATVTNVCAVTANPLAFGSYDPTSATPLDGATTLQVNCTTGTVYTVALSVGGGTGATAAARKMRSGGNELLYAVYQDSNRSVVWGNTPGTDTPAAATATTSAATINVYGQVAARQNVPAGTYSDALTVTVAY